MRRPIHDVNSTGDQAVGEVVANERASRPKNSGGLVQRGFPLDDVVQHQEAHDHVEAPVVERKRHCARLCDIDPVLPEGQSAAS